MKRKSIRQRLLDALFDGVFADILRIRQTPCDLLMQVDHMWTFHAGEPTLEDIGLYDRTVGDDSLWPPFEAEHIQVRLNSHAPMSIFDAHPDLSAEDALELACSGEMIAQNLRTLEMKFRSDCSCGCNDSDLHATYLAWNQASDLNLCDYLDSRRALRSRSRRRLRAQLLPWLALVGVTPLVPLVPDMPEMLVAGSALILLVIQEMISHFRKREALTELRNSDAHFSEHALKLSRKIGFDTAMRHRHLMGLMQKASERISQILAERREHAESRVWIKTLLRWFAVREHLRARIEALRECLRIRIGYHTTLYRGDGIWSGYLDAYDNHKDVRKAGEAYLPPVPRVVGRRAWWAMMAAGGVAGAIFGVVPHLSLDGSATAVWGVSALSGFCVSALTAWRGIGRIEAAASSDASFVRVTTEEACQGDIRRDIAAVYERDMIELMDLLAKWTQPDMDPHYRR